MEREICADLSRELREAAMSGDVSTLRRLADGGADLTVKFGGWSLLHSAVWAGQLDAADFLMKHGLKPTETDLAGSTSLHLAARRGEPRMTELILSSFSGLSCLNMTGANGSRPLHLAARCGNPETVKMLLELGADTQALDAVGRTPIDWARRNAHPEVVRLLETYQY